MIIKNVSAEHFANVAPVHIELLYCVPKNIRERSSPVETLEARPGMYFFVYSVFEVFDVRTKRLQAHLVRGMKASHCPTARGT